MIKTLNHGWRLAAIMNKTPRLRIWNRVRRTINGLWGLNRIVTTNSDIKMRDVMRTTCPKSEYLEISSEILAFAKELLSPDEIEEAEIISINLSRPSTRLNAQRILKKMIGNQPKRPIYYASKEVTYLPRWTRYIIENMGHYIDLLVKCVAAEKLSNLSYHKHSLASNVEKLKKGLPNDLYLELKKYDNLVYREAKHNFNVKNRSHLFTGKEAVFIIFITLKIKDQLISISDDAKKFSEEQHPYYPY